MPLQTLKGFRDLLPPEKIQRDWVMGKIIAVFARYGFLPLETPTLEYRETIMGKYGEEADKLVYQFRDNGDREVALRYDQTVPTARVVAQYRNDLSFPFRRYQTQNVFRADKPQKGRYREFTQCDIDIFGSTSPLADAEILATTYAAYKNVGFTEVQLIVNDRQVLMAALTPFVTDVVSVFSIIQSIDKLDKLPPSAVASELVAKGLSSDAAEQVLQAIQSAGPSDSLRTIMKLAMALGVPESALVFSPTTARGLDYYTGMIFEIRIPGYDVGSVGGGGRYDNLIEQLSGMATPAVGMAFGFDRTVEAAVALNIVPNLQSTAQVLVTVFAEELQETSAQTAAALRGAQIATELYTGSIGNLGKQFKFANQKAIPYVVVIGPDEKAQDKVMLKDMQSGEQSLVSLAELITKLQN
jgi:histidyl-tRNA synthetase